jgi:hypothetical protein
VPAGKALFFPILNAIFGAVGGDCQPSNPGALCNLADLRVATAASIDSVKLTASIDRQPLQNLNQQRVQSPVLTITLPADNVYGYTGNKYPPDGTYAPNVSDGYWLMVPPLSPGNHTIYFKGVVGTFTVEVTYNLTVQRSK